MKNKLWLGLLLMAVIHSRAQNPKFAYSRTIGPVEQEGWYKINLPPAVLGRLNGQLSDLRIYHFGGGDTIKSPYVLKIHNPEVIESEFELQAFNVSRKDNIHFFTFETGSGAKINYLSLDFAQPNYDARVKIEGSSDQKNWFSLAENKRIISISNDAVNFESSVVRFSSTDFDFLRIAVSGPHLMTLEKGSFSARQEKKGRYFPVSFSRSDSIDTKNKESIIELTLPFPSPVSQLKVSATHRLDFYRPFVFEALADSVKSPNGWHYLYEEVASGYLTSIDSNRYNFSSGPARKFRLTVHNHENKPLNIDSISLYGTQTELWAFMNSGDSYLFYGNQWTPAPSFDIARFEEKIPLILVELSLGPEVPVPVKVNEKRSPFFINKAWLWVILGVVIAILGYFTLRMMKGSEIEGK